MSTALIKAEVLMQTGNGSHTSVVCAPDGRALQLLSPPDRPVPEGLWAALAASERARQWHDPDNTASIHGAALGKRPQAFDGPSYDERTERRARIVHDDTAQHARFTTDLTTNAGGHALQGVADQGTCADEESWYKTSSLNISQSSQGSQSEGNDGEGPQQSQGSNRGSSSQELVHFLDTHFERLVAPCIPPMDPYLLITEKWPPHIKVLSKYSVLLLFYIKRPHIATSLAPAYTTNLRVLMLICNPKVRSKCFVFPKPGNRRFGEQIVYLCSAARRISDNLALQHSIWLATKLQMPLVVLSLLQSGIKISNFRY
jgi:hypothetical protein